MVDQEVSVSDMWGRGLAGEEGEIRLMSLPGLPCPVLPALGDTVSAGCVTSTCAPMVTALDDITVCSRSGPSGTRPATAARLSQSEDKGPETCCKGGQAREA